MAKANLPYSWRVLFFISVFLSSECVCYRHAELWRGRQLWGDQHWCSGSLAQPGLCSRSALHLQETAQRDSGPLHHGYVFQHLSLHGCTRQLFGTIQIWSFFLLSGIQIDSWADDGRYQCDMGWQNFQAGCYWLNTDNLDWNSAHKTCQKMEANLVSIHTLPELEFITKHMKRGTHRFSSVYGTNTNTPGMSPHVFLLVSQI